MAGGVPDSPEQAERTVRELRAAGRLAEAARLIEYLGPYGVAEDLTATASLGAAVLEAYPDWTIPASVIDIEPSADREKGTVKVRIGLKKKDPRILLDMSVKVSFENISAAIDSSADIFSAAN